jgi:predicted RNase H-like nuclease (RuvC/YqgF family)
LQKENETLNKLIIQQTIKAPSNTDASQVPNTTRPTKETELLEQITSLQTELDQIKEKDSEQLANAKKRNKELSNIVDQINDTITTHILDLAALRALLTKSDDIVNNIQNELKEKDRSISELKQELMESWKEAVETLSKHLALLTRVQDQRDSVVKSKASLMIMTKY